MKKAIIIHGWEGHPDHCWYPQTKRELEAAGFEVSVPEMPETDTPKLSLWLQKLKEIAGKPDENLYLIGHSLGCITIMRYLESLSEGEKIRGVVFVAGFTDNLEYKELDSFFEAPIDFEKIKSKASYFTAIYSDNDPYVPTKHADIFKEKLGAELIFKPGMKHFSGQAVYKENCTSLPDVSQAIFKMIK